jgi:hypothetical protein
MRDSLRKPWLLLVCAALLRASCAFAAWTDDPLIRGVHTIKKIHVDEVRNAINIKRANYGFGSTSWTNSPLVVGVTTVKAVHFQEVRNSILELTNVYRSGGTFPCPASNVVAAPTFTNNPLTPAPNENIVIKAVHMTELRQALDGIGDSHACCGICKYASGSSGCLDQFETDFYTECTTCQHCSAGTCYYQSNGQDNLQQCGMCSACDGGGNCVQVGDGTGDDKSCANCDASGGCRY